MIDFIIDIEKNERYLLDIISNTIEQNNVSLDNSIIEISEQDNKFLVIESSITSSVNNLEIEKYNDYNLELTNTVYANLPDEIPMSIISGNLHVSRIDGLSSYLTTIPIDGGSP